MSGIIRAVAAAVVVQMLAATAAVAGPRVELTFEEFPHADDLQGSYQVLSVASGYQFLYAPAPGEPYPVGLQIVGPTYLYNKNGSAAVNPDTCAASVTLNRPDGLPFALKRISLSSLNGDLPVSVTFTGTTTGNEQVVHTVKIRHGDQWERFHFPDTFAHLSQVVWYQGDCVVNRPHMFDDVVLVREKAAR